MNGSLVKKTFKGKVTIGGGLSSVALLKESMFDEEFETFMKNLFEETAPGDQFILGVSDTTPPDANRKVSSDYRDGSAMGKITDEIMKRMEG